MQKHYIRTERGSAGYKSQLQISERLQIGLSDAEPAWILKLKVASGATALGSVVVCFPAVTIHKDVLKVGEI